MRKSWKLARPYTVAERGNPVTIAVLAVGNCSVSVATHRHKLWCSSTMAAGTVGEAARAGQCVDGQTATGLGPVRSAVPGWWRRPVRCRCGALSRLGQRIDVRAGCGDPIDG